MPRQPARLPTLRHASRTDDIPNGVVSTTSLSYLIEKHRLKRILAIPLLLGLSLHNLGEYRSQLANHEALSPNYAQLQMPYIHRRQVGSPVMIRHRAMTTSLPRSSSLNSRRPLRKFRPERSIEVDYEFFRYAAMSPRDSTYTQPGGLSKGDSRLVVGPQSAPRRTACHATQRPQCDCLAAIAQECHPATAVGSNRNGIAPVYSDGKDLVRTGES